LRKVKKLTTQKLKESDLLLNVGQNTLKQIQQALSEDPSHYFPCKHCGKELRPWQDSEVYVVSYHLEEHSGPLLDRIDIHIEVARVRKKDLLGKEERESK